MKKIKFKNTQNIEYELIWKKPTKKYLKYCKIKDADGICSSPNFKSPKILINPKLTEKRLCAVILEEIFHSMLFNETERVARRFAAVATSILYEMGWKRDIKTKKV